MQRRTILKNRINARLFTTGIVLRALANKIYAERGLEITSEQYLILSIIIDNKELYQRQLSEITLKDRANISRIVHILEEKGLVERIISSNGRQIYKLKATEKGVATKNKISPAVKEIIKIATKDISNEELENCLTTLDKIFFNIEDKVTLQI